jgi:hypothetical protein
MRSLLASAAVAALLLSNAALASAATMADLLSAPTNSGKIVRLQTSSGLSGSSAVFRGSGSNGGNGGEFLVQLDTNGSGTAGGWENIQVTVTSSDVDNNWVYKTFCVEESETYVPNTAYYATIDNRVYNNGGAAGSAGVAVANNVKYAYGLYAEGLLESAIGPSYFQYDNSTFAGNLQQFIWDSQDGIYNATTTAFKTQIEAWAAANSAEASHYLQYVLVMNLWSQLPVGPDGGPYTNGGAAQSQLILTQTTPANEPMPEPMTLAMWSGLSILGLGMARRQRRKVSA